MTLTTIYSAKKIITMNPSQPHVSHVAVREGRVLGAGSLAELEVWGEHVLDNRFAEKVLLPGFVEGHAHTMERLKEAEVKMDDPDEPLSGWSLDPIYLNNKRVTRQDLDSVSKSRPIGILHASGHIMNVNSKALQMAGLMKTGINHPGMPLGADGIPTGELYGPETMTPVGVHVGFNRSLTDSDEQGLRDFGKLCVRTGVTTITDLAARLEDDGVKAMLKVTGDPRYPARVVPLKLFMGSTAKETVERALELKDKATDMLRLGRIKAVADGSIQGFSARMRWPGYYNGASNGLWYTAPEQLAELYRAALKADIQVHTHTNGDEATEMVLDTLGPALKDVPHPDHRFTLQHCQLADAAQFRRMKALSMCVNLFANHHFYWGDEHYRLTVGPERALRMNACRTALNTGVPMAIHSDAPVTPLGPLFTAWAAVNRTTASGRTQGDGEKIIVSEALQAITLGAAYTLHLDDEVGSIEVGKKADFAVLEDDPTEVNGEDLKDVRVWGTVQGGRVFAAADL